MSSVGVGRALARSQAEARARRLVGDTTTNQRRKDDFYPTPPAATAALLAVEPFIGSILEPACGDGAISRLLEAGGHAVVSTDLIDRGYGEHGRDFLMPGYPYRADNVVTNPPFKLGAAFVERALAVTTAKVAMLLRLTFLETRERAALFARTPLKRVWVFERRLAFPIPGRPDAGGGMLCFAWFVWEHGHAAAPTLGWLDHAPSQVRPRGVGAGGPLPLFDPTA